MLIKLFFLCNKGFTLAEILITLGIIGVIAAAIIKSINKNKEYSGDKYQNLERLQKLKEQGVITEEEFNAEKKKILG